ncbi:MAG: ChbG/HpnK family deacetylase [Bacteroidales bacterium]|nr:ChbG/HpnK family deacetylase [Bacteroidales bacterium]
MKIILSADDFGRSQERNRAIDDAFRMNLIESAGLLVNAEYTKDAVQRAMAGGYVQRLHCHFNIESGEVSGGSLPLSQKILSNNSFCHQGDFRGHNDISLNSYVNPFLSTVIFDELEKQYLQFRALTGGNGNDKHVDFHLWDNYRFPVSVALRKLIEKYNITSYRQQGLHHVKGVKKVFRIMSAQLCKNPNCRMNIPSSCIDWFLHANVSSSIPVIEAYVHPDYVSDVLMDNTCPVFSSTRYPLAEHVAVLKDVYGSDFISWKEI